MARSNRPTSIRLAATGALALLPVLGSLLLASGAARAEAGDVANAIRRHALADLDGKPLSWSRLEGQVVVVGFWASWCKPCRHEMPKLAALHAALAPKGGRVVAISIDQDPENARRFVKKHGLALPVYPDGPDGLARTLDLQQIPYTIVLDRDGRVAYTARGAGEEELERLSATAHRLAGTPGGTSAAQVEGAR